MAVELDWLGELFSKAASGARQPTAAERAAFVNNSVVARSEKTFDLRASTLTVPKREAAASV